MLNNITDFFSSGSNVMFFVFALCVISGAVFMISFTKVVHMVVSIAFTFLSLAGLYVLLEAEFVAFVQVLIYAGAVTILMIFGIMMTRHQGDEVEPRRPLHSTLLALGVLVLFGCLFYAIQSVEIPSNGEAVFAGQDNTLEIGRQLFTLHVIPFELVSLLLTVAFIGAIVVAKREED